MLAPSSVELISINRLGDVYENPIGSVQGVEFYNDRVFVLDLFKSRSVFAYDTYGKFINKTISGQAPGEVSHPFAFFHDQDKDQLRIWDQAQSAISIFDKDLNFVSRSNCPQLLLNFAQVNASGDYLLHCYFSRDYVFKLYNSDCDEEKGVFIPDYDYSGVLGVYRSISTGESTFLIAPLRYSIYEYLGNEVVERYFIDFGKLNITEEEIKSGLISGNSEAFEGSKVSSLNNIGHNDSYISFFTYFKEDILQFVIDRQREELLCLNALFDSQIPKCKVYGVTEDNIFYA